MGKDRNEEPRATAARKPRVDGSGYETVWVEATPEELAELQVMATDLDAELLAHVDVVVGEGWKLSIGSGAAGVDYVAALTCRDRGSASYQRVFLMRHPDWRKAILGVAVLVARRVDGVGIYRDPGALAALW